MGHKREKPEVKEDISPNLIPMIDIMFLLLLFFMLGADMSQRESVEVKLPLADQVKEDKEKVDPDPETTVNIYPDPGVNEEVFKNAATCRDAENGIRRPLATTSRCAFRMATCSGGRCGDTRARLARRSRSAAAFTAPRGRPPADRRGFFLGGIRGIVGAISPNVNTRATPSFSS